MDDFFTISGSHSYKKMIEFEGNTKGSTAKEIEKNQAYKDNRLLNKQMEQSKIFENTDYIEEFIKQMYMKNGTDSGYKSGGLSYERKAA